VSRCDYSLLFMFFLVGLLPFRQIRDSSNTMCDLNNKHGDAIVGVTFAVYMLLISYLTLLVVLFSDLLDVLSLIL
jgi:hypothetical protein